MIPRSGLAAGMALAVSVGVHLGGLALSETPEPVLIAGGGGGVVAVEGTAFADMAQGTATPVTAERAPAARMDTVAAMAGSVSVDPATPPATGSKGIPDPSAATTPEAAPMPDPSAASRPETINADAVMAVEVPPIQALLSAAAPPNAPRVAVPTTADAVPVSSEAALADAPPAPSSGSVVSETASAISPALMPVPSATVVPQTAPSVAPKQTVTALTEEDATTTPRISARPRSRPTAVEERAAVAQASRAAPAERVRAEQASRPRTATAAPSGNANRIATRGSAGGSAAGRATSSGQGRAEAAGNAAISNYPGQVRSCVARAASRVRGGGGAQAAVSFRVGSNGRIGAVNVSGDARLARSISRAVSGARCPPPPPGASTSFNIPVRVD
jgi:hypothetical protein